MSSSEVQKNKAQRGASKKKKNEDVESRTLRPQKSKKAEQDIPDRDEDILRSTDEDASSSESQEKTPHTKHASCQCRDCKPKKPRTFGGDRKKIPIQYIENKDKRQVSFCKRKTSLLKKAYELCTLTGSNIAMFVQSESGTVYTFASNEFRPLIEDQYVRSLIVGGDSSDKPESKKTDGNVAKSDADREEQPAEETAKPDEESNEDVDMDVEFSKSIGVDAAKTKSQPEQEEKGRRKKKKKKEAEEPPAEKALKTDARKKKETQSIEPAKQIRKRKRDAREDEEESRDQSRAPAHPAKKTKRATEERISTHAEPPKKSKVISKPYK